MRSNGRSMLLLFCTCLIWLGLSKGEHGPDLQIGDKPPKDSCEVPAWDKFNIRATSEPEPRGGPDGSICNATMSTSVVQVIEWTCGERYCCEPPCDCSSANLQTSRCQKVIPGFQPMTLVCLVQRSYWRKHRLVCCKGYMEDERRICVKILPQAVNSTTGPLPLDKESHWNATSLGLLISFLVLLLLVIIAVLIGVCIYCRRRKRRKQEKVIFSTDVYENETYADVNTTGATSPVLASDMTKKGDMEKAELALRVDHFAINPLYGREVETLEYSGEPAYPAEEKAVMFYSSSPFASGLPAYDEHLEKKNLSPMDNKVTTGFSGNAGSLLDRHPLRMESLDNKCNDDREGGIYCEIK